MLMIMLVVKWAVVVYLLCGIVLSLFALYYANGTRDKYPQHERLFTNFREATPKEKIVHVMLGIWYGVICWLPIVTGKMTRPTNFKFH